MIVFSALMIWKGIMAFTNSESPVVVVLRFVGDERGAYWTSRRWLLSSRARLPPPVILDCSGSMEPAFQRGDILFLDNRDESLTVGM